jgi:hypothetical protein
MQIQTSFRFIQKYDTNTSAVVADTTLLTDPGHIDTYRNGQGILSSLRIGAEIPLSKAIKQTKR